jgi:hypothetical protein
VSAFTDEVNLTSSSKGLAPRIGGRPLTDTELQSILSKLDDVMRPTRELSEQIIAVRRIMRAIPSGFSLTPVSEQCLAQQERDPRVGGT